MENQFTRMQKLAGLINEGFTAGNNSGEESKQARDILKNAGLTPEEIQDFMLNNSFGKGDLIGKAKEYTQSLNENLSTISKSDFKNMIREMVLAEAKKDEKEEEDVEIEDTETVDTEEIPTEDTPEGNPDDILDALKTALNGAKALGDEKLVDQIGNTITFYTRVHIVGQEMDMD